MLNSSYRSQPRELPALGDLAGKRRASLAPYSKKEDALVTASHSQQRIPLISLPRPKTRVTALAGAAC